jgi:glycine/D-amino acid oxidase-like deaminating enzyme
MSQTLETPHYSSYDVIIVGGAMYGSSVAWFLADNPEFDGSILVVEKDPTYEFTSTAHTNSCMRQHRNTGRTPQAIHICFRRANAA